MARYSYRCAPATEDRGRLDARYAYWEYLHDAYHQGEVEQQSERQGGRSNFDAPRCAYHEQLHGKSSVEYPRKYNGGMRWGGAVVGEESESEEDDSDNEEREVSYRP
nr:unnamed protein product [Digitaria exilis]